MVRGSRIPPRYEAEHGWRHCHDNRLCVECGAELTGRRRRWCSDECVDAYRIRSDEGYLRLMVHRRDQGVCALCDLDCDELKEKIKDSDRAALKTLRAEIKAIIAKNVAIRSIRLLHLKISPDNFSLTLKTFSNCFKAINISL